MLTILALRMAGVFLLGLFVLNFFVPARFKWDDELSRLSLINRRIFQVHAMSIAAHDGFVVLLGLVAEERQLESSLSTNRTVAVRARATRHREDRTNIVHETDPRCTSGDLNHDGSGRLQSTALYYHGLHRCFRNV